MKLTPQEKDEVTCALQDRLKTLDKLFKKCIDSGQTAASEKVADSVRECREAWSKIKDEA